MPVAGAEVDHVVVGLGAFGSAAAYWLSRRAGAAVVGVEQFELGHALGASQDHSRIIRLSYHRPFYVELAAKAYQAWSELEADAGERLIVRTGGLDLWPPGAAIPMEDYTSSLSAARVPFEVLDAGAVIRRWPQWRLSDDTVGMFQEAGGIAPAARCNEAHRRMAIAHGGTLRDRTAVTAIEDRGGELVVRLSDGTAIACRTAVVCADAWTNDLLLPLGITLPLMVTQEQVTYFAAADPELFAPERFPIWIWMDDPSFYGFPAFGLPGPKAAQDCGGGPTTPETRTHRPDPENLARVRRFVEEHLPEAGGEVIDTRTCLYTLTPDRDFVIDAVPGHPNVLVALGAAHGFKFASLIGRILADLAVDGRTDADLEPFRIDRPILTMADPPTSWMV
jgi:monomeric sarcosine oxidase